jgi:uncharacterized protein (DUF2062 family)
MTAAADAPGGGRLSRWTAQVRSLLVSQLRQGATPRKLALSVAIASALSLFPVLGTTTLLCIVAAALLRLNHPLVQLVNYLCAGLQLALLLPLLKAGEWLGAPHLSLSLAELTERFRIAPWDSLGEFGLIALGGIGAWALAAPLWVLLVYLMLYPLLQRLAERRSR